MTERKSLDISQPVAEFKRQCLDWAQYNPDLNSIQIQHFRKSEHPNTISFDLYLTTYSYELLDDLFAADETKPVRSKKTKSGSASKKRNVQEADLEVSDPIPPLELRLNDILSNRATVNVNLVPAMLMPDRSAPAQRSTTSH
jgi:hypothetical protein